MNLSLPACCDMQIKEVSCVLSGVTNGSMGISDLIILVIKVSLFQMSVDTIMNGKFHILFKRPQFKVTVFVTHTH